MLKHQIVDALLWAFFIIVLIIVWLSMTGCGIYNPDLSKEGVTWKKGAISGKPAKNKPIYVDRANYRTEKDFKKALCKKIAWLEGKGYEITLVRPVYEQNIRQQEVLRYYVIFYQYVKNGTR